MLTEYIPTEERTTPRYPLILTTGRVLTQYNVGTQTRRTKNVIVVCRRPTGNSSA